MNLRLALAAALVAGLSLTTTPAHAAGTDPTTLPRGADAASTYLAGRVLHTANGTITMPVPASHGAQLRLLGKVDGSWILVDQWNNPTVLLAVRHGRARVFHRYEVYDPATAWTLARGGRTVVQWHTDRGGWTYATAYDVDGSQVGHHVFHSWGSVLDAVGDRFVIGVRHTFDWTPGSDPQQVGTAEAEAADVARDLLFVRDGSGYGPTSLSAPGVPAWTADFVPRLVSRGGSYVAGLDEATRHRFEIRDETDGRLLRVFRLGYRPDDPLRWESDDALLVGVRTSLGRALVRCLVSTGRCVRASDWSPRSDALTVPYQAQYFGDYS